MEFILAFAPRPFGIGASDGKIHRADQHAFLARAADHLAVGVTLAFETRNLQGKTYGNTSDYTLWRSFQDQSGRWIDVWVTSRFDAPTMIDHIQLVRKVRETGETWPSQIDLRYIGVEELNRGLAEHGFTVVAQYGTWARSPACFQARKLLRSVAGKSGMASPVKPNLGMQVMVASAPKAWR
jgi:hypothetical protein